MTAKNTEFSFTVETAYGNKLDSPIAVKTSYDHASALEDVPVDERLSPEDELKVINAARKAAARAAATTKALTDAGIKKPDLSDANFRLATMVKTLVAAGYSEADAEQVAKSALKM